MILRRDYGTENGDMATAQIAFRLHHVDDFASQKSFMNGTSTGNIVSLSVHKGMQ